MFHVSTRGVPALNWTDQAKSAFLENILTDEPPFVNDPPGSGYEDDAGLLKGSDDEVSCSPPPKPVLPSKIDRFSVSIHHASYKASALTVRALNVSSLLSAYQAELHEDMGKQLEKGSDFPCSGRRLSLSTISFSAMPSRPSKPVGVQ